MFKTSLIAFVILASLSATVAPSFASAPESLIPTSESDKPRAHTSNNDVPQSLVPTSESDRRRAA